MGKENSRRNFLKYGFIGIATAFAAATSVKFDKAEKFAIGDLKLPQFGVSEAKAVCGAGLGCGGGGGMCGAGLGCSGS